MLSRILATTALSVFAVGAAFADNTQIATLAAPTIKQEQILDATIWRCADTVCRSASAPRDSGVSACRAVAKRFGKVEAYTSGDKMLTPEQLETCNQAAKAQ